MNRKRLTSLFLLVVFGVALTAAQLVTGRLTTSFYAWDRYDSIGVSQKTIRAFQAVQLSAAQGNYALHTSFTGTTNVLGDFGDVGRVRLYSLYFSALDIGKTVDLHVGRQFVYAGAGNGTIDGLMAQAHFAGGKIRATGYAGAPVPVEYTSFRTNLKDYVRHYGGQIVTTAIQDARIGLSYSNRQEDGRDPYWALRVRDSLYSPVRMLIMSEPETEELGSADASYSYDDRAFVYGRCDYDFGRDKISRAQGGLRVDITSALAVTGDFVHRLPRVAYNSIFSAFVTNAVDEVEGGVEYSILPMLRAFGRVASVSYSDEKSTRWTLGVNSGFGTLSYSGSDGYAGELQSLNLQGSYPLLGQVIVPTAGVSYASYRLSTNEDRSNALGVLLGALVRPTPTVTVDLQAQMLNNKLMNHDLRLQAKLSYRFAQRLSIFHGEGDK
jgi:hypothetical protein